MHSKVIAAILAAFLFVVIVPFSGAQEDQNPTTTIEQPAPPPAPPPQIVRCIKTVRYHNSVVRHYVRYSHSGGNYVARPISKKGLAKIVAIRRCAADKHAHKRMIRFWRHEKNQWDFHRYIDSITPYGEWAIPPYVVMCESGGNYSVFNHGGSGASGAYQIMSRTWYAYGGGRYASAAAYAPPYAQHIVARRIWFGQGSGAWSCA